MRGTAISNDLQFSEDKAVNAALLAQKTNEKQIDAKTND